LANEGKLDEAEEHFRAVLRLDTNSERKQSANLNLGYLLEERGFHSEAVEHYTRVIELGSERPETLELSSRARLRLTEALLELGKPEEAEPHYRALLESGPQESSVYVTLANALSKGSRFGSARWVFERGREALPQDATIASLYARFLATCPDDTIRDGPAALQLASGLFSAHRSGPHATTLAAALAENSRFQEAANLQRAAIAEAEKLGRADLAEKLRQHLTLYERGQPLRQP
jgi:tetratricopeptide (TPR) repeat protein